MFSITILFILPPNKEMPQSFPCGFNCGQNRDFGRSGRIRTDGIEVPNFARYQLRHTPIGENIQFFRSNP